MKKDNPEAKKTHSDLKFKEVQKVWGPAEAEVIKSLLDSHGITSFTRGQVVQSVHAFSVNGLGEIKIFVPEEDFELAKEILSHQKESPEKP